MAVQSGVYRGATATQRAAERRARLLEATLTVWADPDVRTTMTAVCAEAGLTERYFYEAFAHLDDARAAVLDEIATRIERASREAADAAGDDPSARIRASVAAFVDLVAADPRTGRVALIEAVATPELRARRTELLRRFAHQAATDAAEMFAHDVAAGGEGAGGDGPDGDGGDGEMAGLLFIGGMAELVTAWLDGSLVATPDEITDQASRMYARLYR